MPADRQKENGKMKNDQGKKEKRNTRERTPVSKAVFALILTLAIGVFVVSGLKLLSILTTYKKAENTYERISRDASVMNTEKGYPTVDFAALLAQNADTAGYIYCEDLFEYPIVQGQDNDYYLHTMFDGTYNPSGAIFIDSRIPERIEARNCVIYGHNMNDGSMFGTLYKYSDPEFYEKHRIFHVYTPEHHYVYKAVAAYTAAVDGFTYTFSFGSDEDFLRFLEQTQNSSWFESDTELTEESKIITLSTCLGNNSDDYRNVLILARESEITE